VEQEAEAQREPGHRANRLEAALESFVFASRWVQAPLYVGLVLAMVVYACIFCSQLVEVCLELRHLGSEHVEEQVMMGVLTLVDITMVANLVVMVVVGGYATFVSRLDLTRHVDRPDWLQKIDAGTMKVKLAGSLVGISAIHLLKSFINIDKVDERQLMWQVIIHGVFLMSGLLLATTERVLYGPAKH
jgi:uncharacterized protein (TIGR00645 family)